MEKFKAVEKAMKTKAYSKEGLSGPIKLDPKEQQKVELCDFLSNMVDGLEQQVEALEAEAETLQAGMKKGKANKDKANRVAEIERIIEKHKFHQAKLELIQRSLENGSVEIEPVEELKDSIEYYVAESAGGADPQTTMACTTSWILVTTRKCLEWPRTETNLRQKTPSRYRMIWNWRQQNLQAERHGHLRNLLFQDEGRLPNSSLHCQLLRRSINQ